MGRQPAPEGLRLQLLQLNVVANSGAAASTASAAASEGLCLHPHVAIPAAGAGGRLMACFLLQLLFYHF